MENLRTVAMYKAANRPLTILGAERELMLLLMIVCFALIITGLSLITTVIGIGAWVVGASVLRRMAKQDPMMSKVFLRYWANYSQRVFPATARPGARTYISR